MTNLHAENHENAVYEAFYTRVLRLCEHSFADLRATTETAAGQCIVLL